MIELYQYIITPIAGVLLAQSMKRILARASNDKTRVKFAGMGGFPSAHTAGITSVTFLILLNEGLSGAVSGLALATSVVIIYDALNLRRSAGDLALIVLALQKETEKNRITRKRIARLKGHTPLEVAGGILVGFIVAITIKLLV